MIIGMIIGFFIGGIFWLAVLMIWFNDELASAENFINSYHRAIKDIKRHLGKGQINDRDANYGLKLALHILHNHFIDLEEDDEK